METTFYLKQNNKNESKGTIYFCFSHLNSKLRLSTSINCAKKDWANGYLKQTSATTATRNTLSNYKIKIDKYIQTSISESQRTPTKTELALFVLNLVKGVENNEQRKTVNFYVNEFIILQNSTLAVGTMRYKTKHLNHFIDFVGNKICLIDLNEKTLKDYKEAVKKQVNETSTLNSYIKTIISFLNWLHTNKLINSELTTTIKKEVETEKSVIALNESELITLEGAILSIHQQQQLDIFLLMCYTACDISTLKSISKDSISNNIINVRRQKTGQLIKIPLIKEALFIYEKYNFKLPFINDVKLNEKLKEIFLQLGLDRKVRVTSHTTTTAKDVYKPLYEVISSHKGRKTAITTALSKGIPQHIVMQLSGHQKLSTFRKYVDYSDQNLQAEMNKMSRK